MHISQKQNVYDAIVIGSGISGGWAAKELCEKGLKTIVLERGRDVKHITDYPTAMWNPWNMPHGGMVTRDNKERTSGTSIMQEPTVHWALPKDEQPIVKEQPFSWVRGYHMGGKSLLWARQTQRWSDFDFEGPARDGFAVDWPIRYTDIAPWYSHVEKFAGIAGNKDNIPHLPDGEFLPPFEMSCVEKHFQTEIAKNYTDRQLIHGRCAHLTEAQEQHNMQGRGSCQRRDLCARGCPYGGYFSSNASTLPWAAKTGNLTLRPHAVVESILYDETKKRAIGVRIVDGLNGQSYDYFAKIIFVNASTINSGAILLNSISNRFPNGLGNDNGLLGKYLAWHNYRGKGSATYNGKLDFKTFGKNPSSSYMPRFRNVATHEMDFYRGYSIGMAGGRYLSHLEQGIGQELKNNLLKPTLNAWRVASWMQGETVPLEQNHFRLHPTLKDKYGIPQIVISATWAQNDIKMADDFVSQIKEMYEKAGFEEIKAENKNIPPGADIHEMGGVRMGNDPKTSLLNKWNALHTVPNVFVTDGACMTSTASQNPSLTYMALTARAVDYAVSALKRGQI